ncbi:MAG: hypothetical protein WCO94_11580, partial [Verrucomicrobiota bacterium]
MTKTYQLALAPTGEYTQSSYIQGADAGSLSITAPAMALAGKLSGATITGERQLRSSGSSSDLSKAGTLTLSFRAQEFRASDPVLQRSVTLTSFPTPPLVTIDESAVTGIAAFSADSNGVPAALDSAHAAEFHLSPRVLTDGGFGSLTVNNEDGGIIVPENVTLTTPASVLVSLTGSSVDVRGRIVSPGGSVSLKALNVSPYKSSLLSLTDTPKTPKSNPDRGTVSLGPRASISVAGTFVDDRPMFRTGALSPISINAGSVSLSGFNVELAAGSVIDASGGVTIAATGARKFGNGGSISILAGQDPETKSVVGGKLVLDGALKAFSGGRLAGIDSNGNVIYPGDSGFRGYAGGAALEAKGGSLSIQATRIQVGGNAAGDNLFVIQPSFFKTGGFTSYSITGLGRKAGDDAQDAQPADAAPVTLSAAESLAAAEVLPAIEILPNTVIEPVASSFRLDGGAFKGLASVRIVTNQASERAPASISFEATGVSDFSGTLVTRGDLVMGESSVIRTDPEARVSLKGHTVAVLGSISAPGGTITITGSKYSKYSSSVFPQAIATDNTGGLPTAVPVPLTTVYIGSRSTLSTKGTIVLYPDSYGRKVGRVLRGGTISVAGNIVAATGAVLDVSGISATVDVLPSAAGVESAQTVSARSGLNAVRESLRTVPKIVDTDAGTISFDAGPLLLSDATLKGFAGGSSANGGSLSVSAIPFRPTEDALPSDTAGLVIAQSGKAIASAVPDDRTAIGSGVFGEVARAEVGAKPLKISGSGFFAADQFLGGGFDSLTLSGVISFVGRVDIAARNTIKLGDKGVILADDAVNLSAPYVRIGSAYIPPQQTQTIASPTDATVLQASYGTGRLNIASGLIDVGSLTLRNIGKTTLSAEGGDIRGYGTLSVAGDLTLRAAQIYPATASTFTIIAADYSVNGATRLGSVTVEGSGTKKIPLSAGGTLQIYASNITQSGTLRAPFGTISIGWDGTGTAPVNALTGLAVSATSRLVLGSEGITSVSAVNPATGEETTIPYGVSLDGSNWISPAGTDITSSGLPSKTVQLSAQNLDFQSGAAIDVRGGGDLLAYRWIEGKGGSKDILSSSGSFAILPGYDSGYIPYATFNDSNSDSNLISNSGSGYANSSLQVGDKIHLSGSKSLAAGAYTLLPARYGVMPGAILVTPKAGSTRTTVETTEGASIVSGYSFNSLNTKNTGSPLATKFEVVSGKTLSNRAEYEALSANSFLAARASDLHQTVQLLPKDSGYVLFQSTASMNLSGLVRSKSVSGGRGAFIDINTPLDIVITGADAAPSSGTVSLNAARLTSWDAESLLIGGVRDWTKSNKYAAVNVQAKSITLDNAGAPLQGTEIILAANRGIVLAPGAQIQQSGTLAKTGDNFVLSGSSSISAGDPLTITRAGGSVTFADGTPGSTRLISSVAGTITLSDGTTTPLTAGTSVSLGAGSSITLSSPGTLSLSGGTAGATVPVSLGDGVFLRVTSDPSASNTRSSLAYSATPSLVVGAGAQISAGVIVLDSTAAMTIERSSSLKADAYSIGAGKISIQLANAGTPFPAAGLVIGGDLLDNFQNASRLALRSYSDIDFYGSGRIGSGRLLRLTLSAGQLVNQGLGSVTLAADNVRLDNANSGAGAIGVASTGGAFRVEAKELVLGENQMFINRFAEVTLSASTSISGEGVGGVTSQRGLTLVTPVLTGASGSIRSFAANAGSLSLQKPESSPGSTAAGGLGATLSLTGPSVSIDSNIVLPGGSLTARATTGNLRVSGTIDVSGTQQTFYDVTKFTDAGEVKLFADAGSVVLAPGSLVNLSAAAGGGNAGLLQISVPAGSFTASGSLMAGAGTGFRQGSFSLDVLSLPNLSVYTGLLAEAGFSESQSFRVRGNPLVVGSGDVLISGTTVARNFTLSTDLGKIDVGNAAGGAVIDASGPTGGSISLSARGDVVIWSGSLLTVRGDNFSNAGKGGTISLAAGSERNGSAGTGRVTIKS